MGSPKFPETLYIHAYAPWALVTQDSTPQIEKNNFVSKSSHNIYDFECPTYADRIGRLLFNTTVLFFLSFFAQYRFQQPDSSNNKIVEDFNVFKNSIVVLVLKNSIYIHLECAMNSTSILVQELPG